VLTEVRAILRDVVVRAGGREIDARADEFFAAFEQARAAVQAAVSIQRRLTEHKWDDGADVRVRVGIHSGRPTLTDAGYIGLAVHTTARVCWTAHGGQIVVSAATRGTLGTETPAGVRFRPLGRHRLPGLPEPEPLFQVHAQGLRATFPALRTGRRSVARRLSDDGDRRASGEKSQLELPQPPS
jgi:class 3 adenylate cyclase